MNGALHYDSVKLGQEIDNLKRKRDELASLAEQPIKSVDYISGPNKELIDKRLNRVNEEILEEIALVNRTITSLENAKANYEAREQARAETIANS